MSNNYGNDSIDQLKGAERIRTRPASMLGSSGLAGARHGFTEMYGNALDERTAGYGDRLDVKYYSDGSISIRDYGRGVPLGWNNRPRVQNWNWHTIYNELYAGGKYDNGQWYLLSIDRDSHWIPDTDKYGKLHNTLLQELSFDIETLPMDSQWYAINDLNIRHNEDGSFDIRVNNESWATLTWEKLNKRLNYLASVGLNGLGAASTQYTSEYFEVKSYTNGVCTSRSFKRGKPIVNGAMFDMFSATKEEIMAIPEEKEDTDEPNGTFVHWKPDDTVFTNVNVGSDWLLETCMDIAGVAGVTLTFEDETTGNSITIESSNLDELLKSKSTKSRMIEDEETGEPILFQTNNFSHGITHIEGDDFVYVCRCDMIFGVGDRNMTVSCYHNSVKMQAGVQYEAVSSAIYSFMSERAKARGLKLERSDYEGIFGVVVSSYSNYASFRNQTKDAVDDMFIYNLIEETLFNELKLEYGKGNFAICDAVDRVLQEAETRIEAKEYAKMKRDSDRVKREKAPTKFVSCEAYEKKQYQDAELWIVEGDSACTSIKEARHKGFQAIYPIRGKALNVLKANIKRVLANKEIREIFSIIGTGFDLNIKGEKTFNIEDLRFGKIIFATDADEDGYQIRVLLFLIFYRFAPELLRQGYIYIAETPRFMMTMRDGSLEFALNDAEKDAFVEKNGANIVKIDRFKGLGQVNKDILHDTTVAPATRNLVQITCDFESRSEWDLIDALFGADKYKQRKEIIASILGADFKDMIDENALLFNELEETIEDDEVDMEQVTLGAS